MARMLTRGWTAALLVTAAAAVLFSIALRSTAADAAHVCEGGTLAVHFAPPADPAAATWSVEGKIASYDVDARTITANGMTLHVPAGLLIKTNDLGQPQGNLRFAATDAGTQPVLTDPALEAERSIVGGTVIADGDTVFTQTPEGTCMRLEATSVFVELAENGIIGPLIAADDAAGNFNVNGTTVRMNTDPRFPSDLLDAAGNPITIADLEAEEGTLTDVGGYYDSTAGVLFATVVEADFIAAGQGSDTVTIQRAETQGTRARVRGAVSRNPATGQFVPSVSVFRGLANAAGTACAGSQVGTAAVATVDGTFEFRATVSPALTQVCVSSPAGGVDDSPVAQR